MAPPTCAVVPVEVSGWMVNKPVRDDTVRRWELDFSTRRRHPEDPNNDYTSFGEDSDDGMYLHWQLPQALTEGRVDLSRGPVPEWDSAVFPQVPNRWLVLRVHRPDARPDQPGLAAWMVCGDYLDEEKATSPYYDRGGGKATRIGRKYDLLTQEWDPKAQDRLPHEDRLTAVGPGIPVFAAFQPYNEDVFSLHDPLASGGVKLAAGRLSYLVVGWYSRWEDDALAPPHTEAVLDFHGLDDPGYSDEERVAALLDALRWRLPEGTPTGGLQRSLYAGTLLDRHWQTQSRPEGGKPSRPEVNKVRLGLGNGTVDARSAILEQAPPGFENAEHWRLFRTAFEAGCLDELDDAVTRKDREGVLHAASHRTWFTPVPGGFTWSLGDAPGKAPSALTGPPEHVVVEGLNEDQDAYDTAIRRLADLRERLFTLWWLQGHPKKPGGTDFGEAVTTTAGQIAKLHRECFVGDPHAHPPVPSLYGRVPQGDTPEELAASAAAYARKAGLPDNRVLRRRPRQPFSQPEDPTVLLRGLGTAAGPERRSKLPCRVPSGLIASVVPGKKLDENTRFPEPSGTVKANLDRLATHLPWAPLPALLTEFGVLDRVARRVRLASKDARGALSELVPQHTQDVIRTAEHATASWPEFCALGDQPWAPMFLDFKITSHALPLLDKNGKRQWEFDGVRYRWKGGEHRSAASWRGRSLLSDLSAFTVAGRVDNYPTRNADLKKELVKLLARTRREQFVSQSLTGLNPWLARRSPVSRVGLEDAERTLGRLPLPGADVPDPLNGQTPFSPVRANQFLFTSLELVDRFGQTLVLASTPDENYKRLLPQRSQTTTPDTPVDADRKHQLVQLPPRIQQPARIGLEWLSTRDDHRDLEITGHLGPETPVCGWLVPDHRDGTLLVHDNRGRGLGELVPGTGTNPIWLPLPGSPWTTARSVLSREFTDAHPHLGPLLAPLLTGAPGQVRELVATITRAQRTISVSGMRRDPAPALVGGRPVAVARARLRLELQAPPLPDAAWDRQRLGPAADDKNPLRTLRWPVRLGASSWRTDGLVGYFLPTQPNQPATDYRRLWSGHCSGLEKPTYVRPIDTSGDPALRADDPSQASRFHAWLTLLLDPWAALHVTSDILPVYSARLPEHYLRNGLPRVDHAVRTGPLLMDVRAAAPGPGAPGQVGAALPRASSQAGSWSWSERVTGPEPWRNLPLVGAGAPEFSTDTRQARTGYLTYTPREEPRRTSKESSDE
ncbi:hypothetical protein [Nocardiopsis dassonvillei]|uniref:hypothetical protein n=1 Tax=Nocardiopsis dassonvillei TaxID=2014 RepID=UPI003670459B